MIVESKVYIKNMVCDRCIMVVKNVLDTMGLPVQKVDLGSAVLDQPLKDQEEKILKQKLESLGFELLEERKNILTDSIKSLILKAVHYKDEPIPVNFSTYLVENLHQDYSLLSHTFTEVEGMTIEQYTIAQKIERVKELLSYGEKNLTEIAFQLGYASVAYLSSQFKKVTGMTPSQYKKSQQLRQPLDKLSIPSA